MSKIAIVTDSTAVIPEEVAKELNISVVSLTVNFGEKSYKEGKELHIESFFKLMDESGVFPTTSQPAVGDFLQTFEDLLTTHDAIIAVLLSDGVSGTYQSAVSAAKMVGGDITVIDSQIASYSLARMAIEAAQLAQQGESKENIIKHIQNMIETAKAYFIVDSLDHLHRGGRIGGAAALFGSLLQIKPILAVKDGKIVLFEKVRTKRRAIDRAIEILKQDVETYGTARLGIVHSENTDEAEELRERVQELMPHVPIEIVELSPVVGVHIGAKALALLYYKM